MKKILLLLILLILPFATVEAKEDIKVYVFYGDGCSYCERLLTYMNKLEQDNSVNSKYELEAYEVWYDSENIKLKNAVSEYFEYDSTGVPFYIIGENYFVGYSSSYDEKIKSTIETEYDNEKYKDVVAEIIKNNNLKPNKRQKTTHIIDTTNEENTIQTPSSVKTDEEQIEDAFKDFIYDLNEGGKEIFDSIDLNNKELEDNIKKYIESVNITTSNTVIEKQSNDKYLLKTTISAEGDNWSVSGIRVEFTYEKKESGFLITGTNLFDFIGVDNVFKIIKWVFKILFGIIISITLIILLIIFINNRNKKSNVDVYSNIPPQE